MGEWSEYFEDFPEENPANWVGGHFDSQLARRLREEQAERERRQTEANAEIYRLIANARWKAEKERRARKAECLLHTEDCPQCGFTKLNVHRLTESSYLCECQECGIYGAGETREEALERTADAVGEELDWRGEWDIQDD